MKVLIGHPKSVNYVDEIVLIEMLCKFTKIRYEFVYACSDIYNKYHKGVYPFILIEGTEKVFYGFWSFARYIDSGWHEFNGDELVKSVEDFARTLTMPELIKENEDVLNENILQKE